MDQRVSVITLGVNDLGRALCALTQNSPLLLMKSPQALAAPVA
jgi:hypothetical protein